MKIVKPQVSLLWITPNAEQMIELAGRVCYKSESKITNNSSGKFCQMLIKRNHGSMLEHGVASLKFIISRGISHEIVRHRMASYAMESSRYVNYKEGIKVIAPSGLDNISYAKWYNAMLFAENTYKDLIEAGIKPEIARDVLPTCLKTELVVTANFREWLHIFELRISKFAHPDIQSIMIEAKKLLKKECPNIFGDINV